MTRPADRIPVCRQIERLRDRRRETARAVFAAAARAAAEARLERDARAAVVRQRARDVAEHRTWFSGPRTEARLLPMALARLEFLIDQHTHAEAELVSAEAALEAADDARGEAARAFARAEARHQAAELQLAAALRDRGQIRERAEEIEAEARNARGAHA